MPGTLNNNQAYPDDAQADMYSAWSTNDEYEHDSGAFAFPVALSDSDYAAGKSPVSVGRLYPPTLRRTTSFRAEKQGGPPVVPAPVDSGAFVFLGGSIVFPKPVVNTNTASSTWVVTGEYEYVANCPSQPTRDGYVITTQPWLMTAQQYGQANFTPATPDGSDGPITQAGFDAKVAVAQANQMAPGKQTATLLSTTWYPGKLLDGQLVNGGGQAAYQLPQLTTSPPTPLPQQSIDGYDTGALYTSPPSTDGSAAVTPPENGWPSP